MSTKQIILATVKNSKMMMLLILLFNLIASLVSIVQPLAFQKLFDQVLPTRDMKQAIILVITIVLVPILFAVFNGITSYFNNKLGNKLAKELRVNVFQHLLNVGLSKIDKIGKGEIINRLTSQIGQLCNVFIVDTFMAFISNIILLVITVGIMFSMSVELTFVSLISFPLLMILMKTFKKKTYQLDKEYFTVLDRGVNYLNDFFTNIKAVHIHNGQEAERKVWAKWNKDLTQINTRSQVFHNTFVNLMAEIIISVATGVIYGYSLYLIFRSQISVGTLLAFIVILPRLYTIFKTLFTTNIDIERMKVIAKNINDLLLMETFHNGKKDLVFETIPTIKLENIHFHYENNELAGLKGINLEIEPGSFIGIVGISGSGKSTLFELLHRHLEPQKGQIFLNNDPINEFDIKQLREFMGYTPQSSVLWNKSILENIIYPLTKEQMTSQHWEKFNQITRKTKVDLFISSLPNQYETIVENNGTNFSGGEIQRINLARSFMHDSKIMLLDEFTSALDAMIEHELGEILLRFKGHKTMIVIAHRLSTIKHADKVIVIEDGTIKESGSVAELLERQGIFHSLYELQKL